MPAMSVRLAVPGGLDVVRPRLETALRSDVFAPRAQQQLELDAVSTTRRVWMGIGLCGTDLSVGLPADVLCMLAGQELLRRALGVSRSVVLIADSNAIAVGHDRGEVEVRARHTEALLGEVARLLGLPLDLWRGAEVAPWAEVARTLRPGENPYVAHQRVQMEAMARLGARTKVGWSMASGERDESFFDRHYAKGCPGEMAFLYTVCGRALDHRRPRACPYVAASRHERVLLGAGERISDRLGSAPAEADREVRGYQRFLRKIGRALAQMRNQRAPRTAEHLVQDLLDGMSLPPLPGGKE